MRNYRLLGCDVYCEEGSVVSWCQIRQGLEDVCCVFNVSGQVLYNIPNDRIAKNAKSEVGQDIVDTTGRPGDPAL